MEWSGLQQILSQLPSAVEMLDLEAQQSMAWWAMIMASVSIVATLLTAGAVVFAALSFQSSRQAATIAQNVGENQTQAYVHAKSLRNGENGLVLELHNSGLTPATQISVHAISEYVGRGKVTDSINCNGSGFKSWNALGANEIRDVNILEKHRNHSLFRRNAHTGPIFLVNGKIIYVTIFNHVYETDFAFFFDVQHGEAFRRPTALNLAAFKRMSLTSDQLVEVLGLEDLPGQ